MKEEKTKQDQLDELHRRQYELEQKIENGNYTRAEQFVKNVGGKKYLYSEIFKSENVKNMNELSAKNPTAYNFLKSLNGDIENDKGGNSNEYTDFKE